MAHVLTYLKKLLANSAFQVSPRGLLGGMEDGLICLTKRYGLNNATSQFRAAADDRIQLPVGSSPAETTARVALKSKTFGRRSRKPSSPTPHTTMKAKSRRLRLPLCLQHVTPEPHAGVCGI